MTAPRKLSPEEIAEQRRGGRTLAPGVWVDRAGDLHISVPDVLAEIGLPETEENVAIAMEAIRGAAMEAIRGAVGREQPNAELVVQEDLEARPRPAYWPEMVERARLEVRAGATHECREWRGSSCGVEPADRCALCDRVLP